VVATRHALAFYESLVNLTTCPRTVFGREFVPGRARRARCQVLIPSRSSGYSHYQTVRSVSSCERPEVNDDRLVSWHAMVSRCFLDSWLSRCSSLFRRFRGSFCLGPLSILLSFDRQRGIEKSRAGSAWPSTVSTGVNPNLLADVGGRHYSCCARSEELQLSCFSIGSFV
jgi:hypothetical protein